MPQNCPWCGKKLEIKAVDKGKSIHYVCSKCGYKIKEVKKEEKKEEPRVVEVKEEEKPQIKPIPKWPPIAIAAAAIILIIILVRILLVK